MIKRILVALSGTSYTAAAVEHALDMAKTHDASVTGVTCVDIGRLAMVGPTPIGAGAAAHELGEHRIHLTEERVHAAVADFEQRCAGAGVAHEVEHEIGDPLSELMSLARYHDVTIGGLRGIFEYGVIHNPDDMLTRVVRAGVRPIFAVTQTFRPIRRVMIAFNGSPESAKAMRRFVQSEMFPEISVDIVCFNRKLKDAETMLRRAKRYCEAHGLQVQTEMVDKHPRDALVDHATSTGVDLIVMGATSRNRIVQHVLGDTVLAAIRESQVPLYLNQ